MQKQETTCCRFMKSDYSGDIMIDAWLLTNENIITFGGR
jgi:hypothetical protein